MEIFSEHLKDQCITNTRRYAAVVFFDIAPGRYYDWRKIECLMSVCKGGPKDLRGRLAAYGIVPLFDAPLPFYHGCQSNIVKCASDCGFCHSNE